MVTITDRAKAVLALAESKEGLLKAAEKCNAHTQELIANFHRMLQETSDEQKAILDKMAEVDKMITGLCQMKD